MRQSPIVAIPDCSLDSWPLPGYWVRGLGARVCKVVVPFLSSRFLYRLISDQVTGRLLHVEMNDEVCMIKLHQISRCRQVASFRPAAAFGSSGVTSESPVLFVTHTYTTFASTIFARFS